MKELKKYSEIDHYHCWMKETPPCGLKGKHRCCLCEKEVPSTLSEGWEDEFQTLMLCRLGGSWLECAQFEETVAETKSFITSLLSKQRDEVANKWFFAIGSVFPLCSEESEPEKMAKSVQRMLKGIIKEEREKAAQERIEMVEKIKRMDRYALRGDAFNNMQCNVAGYNQALDDILALLTTKDK